MKKYWRQACIGFMRDKKRDLRLADFPLIFKEVWAKSLSQTGIINGNIFPFGFFIYLAFSSAGIFPLNKVWIEKENNAKLLKLGKVEENTTSLNPHIQMFNKWLSRFSYKDHLAKLQHLDIYSPHHFGEYVISHEIKQDIWRNSIKFI